MKKNSKTEIKIGTKTEPKKTYQKPSLKPLGDIRDVTMGGSVGTGDSGNGGFQKF